MKRQIASTVIQMQSMLDTITCAEFPQKYLLKLVADQDCINVSIIQEGSVYTTNELFIKTKTPQFFIRRPVAAYKNIALMEVDDFIKDLYHETNEVIGCEVRFYNKPETSPCE